MTFFTNVQVRLLYYLSVNVSYHLWNFVHPFLIFFFTFSKHLQLLINLPFEVVKTFVDTFLVSLTHNFKVCFVWSLMFCDCVQSPFCNTNNVVTLYLIIKYCCYCNLPCNKSSVCFHWLISTNKNHNSDLNVYIIN